MQAQGVAGEIMTRVVIPFLIFAAMFVGAGFVSGGIVHLGEGLNIWDISLLLIGIVLFVVGSYLHEVRYIKKNIQERGMTIFLVYSLMLSIGIGMASGGMQHFVDTPEYSVYLIPIGIWIGMVAYILKENIQFSVSRWIAFVLGSVFFGFILGGLLFVFAEIMPQSWQHGAHAHGGETVEQSPTQDQAPLADAPHEGDDHHH